MCRFETTPDGIKYWMPDCWPGTVHGLHACICRREPRPTEDRIDLIEKKIKRIERRFKIEA
jgi:hypothetical protein